MEKEEGMRDLRAARIIPFLVLAAAACGQPEQKVVSQWVKDLDRQLADNKAAYNAYFLEHPTEVDEARELLKKTDAKIPAKLQRYASEWQAFTQKERDLKKAVAEAKAAVEREKKTAALSVGEVADLESHSGELITKEILLDLNIKGETQPYVMTLVKYKLEPSSSGQRMQDRWVVRSLKPAA
jgi:hypothetical protein